MMFIQADFRARLLVSAAAVGMFAVGLCLFAAA